jgi:hypothetical protein
VPRTRTETGKDAIRRATGSLAETWIRIGPVAAVSSIRSVTTESLAHRQDDRDLEEELEMTWRSEIGSHDIGHDATCPEAHGGLGCDHLFHDGIGHLQDPAVGGGERRDHRRSRYLRPDLGGEGGTSGNNGLPASTRSRWA